MEKLALVLPEAPPYFPRQFDRCAVIGNSGDLLKTKFGREIDGYDAVIRENGAPTQVANFFTYCFYFCYFFIFMLVLTLFSIIFLEELHRICGEKKHISPA